MTNAKARALSVTTLLGWLLATAAPATPAPPIRFQHLSLEEGLSQSTVLCLFQDRVGYLWLGTEDGLNRYDGYAFTVYKHDVADPSSLPSSFVWAIDEDATGNLWLATDGGGLVMWERSSGRFVRRPETSSPFLRSLRLQGDILWMGTREGGLDRLDLTSGQLTHFAHDPADAASLSNNRVYVLHVDRQGRLWVGTDAGLDRFDAEHQRFVHVLPNSRVRAVVNDPESGLWVGTSAGLWRLDSEGNTRESFRHDPEEPASLGHDQVRALLYDTDGRLWVGTAGGLDLYDPHRQGFLHYRHDRGNANSLADDYILSLTQDRGGVLWVGTRQGGVHKWNPLSWQFGHVAADPDDPQALASGHVTSFAEDRAGRLWIGTFDSGLAVMERRSGEVTRYHSDPRDSTSLSSDRVMALLHDHGGFLWVGTLDGGLARFDPGSGLFKSYRHDPQRGNGPAADGVMSLLEDRDGILWIGTFGGGLSRFDSRRERFKHFRHDPADATSLSAERVTSLAEAPDRRLWVGTDGGGLNLCDFSVPRCQRFAHRADDPTSLAADVVYALRVDEAGGLWAGTRCGLSHLAPGASGFTTFTTRQGLPNDVIYGILPDRQGRLWLSTNNGIASFDPRTGRVRKYAPGDGLQASEFNFGAAYGSLSGEIFFGGINGFNAFYPERLRWIQRGPQVVLTAVSGGVPPGVPADQVRQVKLGFRDERVEFEFSALDFAAPERNRFAYMLDGFDRGWLELVGSRRVTYTNLDPGSYTLRARAANTGDAWSTDELAVEVVVAPAPWATTWALLGYSSAFLGGLLGMVRLQQRRQERQADHTRQLEGEVEERTRQLAERQLALERVNHELTKASISDSLTGLPNRRFLVELMGKEVGLVRRRRASAAAAGQQTRELAFLMIDLDEFKAVNDTAGHAAGDSVLRQMHGVLGGACRSADIAIRWGGDEFLVVARDLDSAHLDVLAERIRDRVAEHVFDLEDGRVARLTCSVGFTSYPFHPDRLDVLTWEQAISVADRALYVAKANGRNAWVGLSSTELTPVIGLLGAIRNDLPNLVRRRQIHVTTSLGTSHELALGLTELGESERAGARQ